MTLIHTNVSMTSNSHNCDCSHETLTLRGRSLSLPPVHSYVTAAHALGLGSLFLALRPA